MSVLMTSLFLVSTLASASVPAESLRSTSAASPTDGTAADAVANAGKTSAAPPDETRDSSAGPAPTQAAKEEFQRQLQRAKMTFKQPTDLSETPVKANAQLMYQLALKHPTIKFEVRYTIWPLDEKTREFLEWEKTKEDGSIMVNPNKLYSSNLQMILLNISGGEFPTVHSFEKTTVQTEYHADWAASAEVGASSEFGEGYQHCRVVALHKDGLADAYVFFLYDSREQVGTLMEQASHSLTFKP